MQTKIARGIAVVVALGAGLSEASAQSFNTIVLSGRASPGTPAGVQFESIFNWSIGDSGTVAIRASLTGPGITSQNNFGAWSGNGVALQSLVRASDPAPGLAGVNIGFNSGIAPTVSDDGSSAFVCSLTGAVTSANNSALYSGTPGNLSLVARTGDVAPGTASPFASLILMSSGNARTAFLANLAGATFNSGLWVGRPGTLEMLACGGLAAPGTAAGVTWSAFSGTFHIPVINNSGQAIFPGGLQGPGVNFGNSVGIWAGTAGNLQLIARGAEPAPGLPTGVVYSSFSSPSINNSGTVLVNGGLTGPGVTPSNSVCLFVGAPQSLSPLARTGSPAPGTAAGVSFLSFSDTRLNDAGQGLIRATLTGSGITPQNDSGLWLGAPGSLQLFAREGQLAPGTAGGVTYAEFTRISTNAHGEVAFVALLDGASSTNNAALFAGGIGDVDLIVRTGQLFDVDPSAMVDARTITSIDLGSNDFTDSGLLAFRLGFVDGSAGVFTFGTLVPEPAAALFVLGCILLGLRKKAR